jgi:hypothetical protein
MNSDFWMENVFNAELYFADEIKRIKDKISSKFRTGYDANIPKLKRMLDVRIASLMSSDPLVITLVNFKYSNWALTKHDNGDLYLMIDDNYRGPTIIKDKFDWSVYGTCSIHGVTSLKGCPWSVQGNFECGRNKLSSLDGIPEFIGGNLYIPYDFKGVGVPDIDFKGKLYYTK